MASTEEAVEDRAEHSSGAGTPSPLDALHADVGVSRTTRSRSSPAARAATSTTSTATAISTASRRCSASTSATAGPTSPRPAPTRPRSSASSPTGPTPIPARSSSPPGSPGSRPGDLNRVFFTSGGSEAVESALKLARQYHKLTGKPNKTKVIARDDRLPRHQPGRAVGHRHHGPARAVRAARRPAAATSPTPTPSACPTALTAERSGRHGRRPGSSSRVPTPSPR